MLPELKATIGRIQQVATVTPDNKDLWFMTGLAHINPRFEGESESFDVRARLNLDIVSPAWSAVEDASGMVALAGIGNEGVARGAEWAILDAHALGVPNEAQSASFIRVSAILSVRDTDGYINRVSFQVTVLGQTTVVGETPG